MVFKLHDDLFPHTQMICLRNSGSSGFPFQGHGTLLKDRRIKFSATTKLTWPQPPGPAHTIGKQSRSIITRHQDCWAGCPKEQIPELDLKELLQSGSYKTERTCHWEKEGNLVALPNFRLCHLLFCRTLTGDLTPEGKSQRELPSPLYQRLLVETLSISVNFIKI